MTKRSGRSSAMSRLTRVLAVASLALSACSGEDDPADTTSPPPPPPPPSNQAPTIGGTPATTAMQGQMYRFIPQASDPDGDMLQFTVTNRPPWASFNTSTGELAGRPATGDTGTTSGIVLRVSDGELSAALPAFSITVMQASTGSATLSWTAPTTSADGSPLTDLAGYRVYYGTQTGTYSNSIRIDNPGVTSYVVDNLAPATYFFATTAFDTSGNESEYSNEISGVVQ